jgi:ubiquinone biosynthesis protein COQ4
VPTIRPHLGAVPRSQAFTAVRAAGRVLADSERTVDIMIAEEIAAQGQLGHLLAAGVFSGAEGAALLADKPDMADVDMAALGLLPPDSLGGALARFHSANGLSASLYQQPLHYTDEPTAAFLMQRIRHSHDIWHVLTGLGVQGHEEILLHAFSLAQTGLPSSIALMALGSLKHMLLEGRIKTFLFGMQRAYRHGRDAEWLLPVYWERYWDVPVPELRRRLRVTPIN